MPNFYNIRLLLKFGKRRWSGGYLWVRAGKSNKVGYVSVVSQNKITEIFKLVLIFRSDSPFARVHINTLENGQSVRKKPNNFGFVKPLSDTLLHYLTIFLLAPSPSSLLLAGKRLERQIPTGGSKRAVIKRW